MQNVGALGIESRLAHVLMQNASLSRHGRPARCCLSRAALVACGTALLGSGLDSSDLRLARNEVTRAVEVRELETILKIRLNCTI